MAALKVPPAVIRYDTPAWQSFAGKLNEPLLKVVAVPSAFANVSAVLALVAEPTNPPQPNHRVFTPQRKDFVVLS